MFLPLPADGDGEGSGGNSGGDTGGNSEGQSEGGSGSSETGYPANTPLAQMTEAQQLAYWKAHAKKHEERARKADSLASWKEQNAAKIEEYDRLIAASKTDHERELDTVKSQVAEQARAEVRGKMVRDLVDAEFRAAARGALSRDQVAKILAPLDPNYFVADGGGVDVEKISAYVAELNPTGGGSGGDGNGNGSSDKRRWPDTGQGRRGADNAQGGSVQSGVELYQRMKKPQTAP